MGNKWKAHRDTKNTTQQTRGYRPGKFELIGLAITLILGYYGLKPRLTIIPGERLESANPLPMLLNVTNNGQLSVYSVKLACEIDSIWSARNTGIEGLSLTDLTSHREEIESGHTATMQCPVGVGPDLAKAEFTARVSFQPVGWLPFRSDTVERFSAHIGQDGKVTWRTKDPIDHKDS